MARYWITGGTGNYNSTTNWSDTSGGASGFSVPTSSDDVIFDANSGIGTANINVSSACLTLDCTNFGGTLNFQNTLAVSGSITLGSGMSFSNTSGTPVLRIAVASGTLTSNGKTFPYTLELFGSGLVPSYTFADNWTVGNLTLNSGSSAMTILGSKTIYIDGDFTESMSATKTATGTTFVLQGTGTWSNGSIGALEGADVNFNSAGTITISGTVRFRGGTISRTAGTMVVTGSTLSMTAVAAGTTTIDTSGMTWNSISIGGISTHTFNAFSTVYLSGLLTLAGGGGIMQGMWDCSGSLSHTGGTTFTNVAGTTITMTGTGSIANTSGGSFSCDITINTSGIITFGTNFRYNTGTLTYTSGTVDTTNSTVTIASVPTTLDVNGNTEGTGSTISSTGINFFNLTLTIGTTLITPICIIGTFSNSNNNCTGATIYIQGNLTTTSNTGSGVIVLNGSGVINCFAMLRMQTTINTNGIYTFAVNFNNTKVFTFNSATLTYIKGIVHTKNVTLLIQASSTLIGIYKLRFKRVSLINTITMDNFFQGSASQICSVVSNTTGAAYTIVFTDGFQKIGNYVSVQDATLTNTVTSRGSLLLTYSKANRGRNIGNITYVNNKPNGLIKYEETLKSLETMVGVQLQGDPAYN